MVDIDDSKSKSKKSKKDVTFKRDDDVESINCIKCKNSTPTQHRTISTTVLTQSDQRVYDTVIKLPKSKLDLLKESIIRRQKKKEEEDDELPELETQPGTPASRTPSPETPGTPSPETSKPRTPEPETSKPETPESEEEEPEQESEWDRIS